MGMDLKVTDKEWTDVSFKTVSEVLEACSSLFGKIIRTVHGPFGDVYVEYEAHNSAASAALNLIPDTIITVWTSTQSTGTKTLKIQASYDDVDVHELVLDLFDIVDKYVDDPAPSHHSVP